MRHLKITALLVTALAMLAVAAVAMASSQFKQSAKVTLSATKQGKATGFSAALASSDPGEPGGKPQALKTLTITLPSATKFNFKTKALTACTASDIEIKGTGGAACPAKSKIGSGSAEANGAPVFPVIPENATAYAGPGNIIFLLSPKGPAGTVLVLHGVVSANKVTTAVPVIAAGGLPIVITALNLKINTVGSGKSAFITAGKCIGGKFTVKSSFLYYTGASLTLSSSSKCSK
jgi:hypothetical protein